MRAAYEKLPPLCMVGIAELSSSNAGRVWGITGFHQRVWFSCGRNLWNHIRVSSSVKTDHIRSSRLCVTCRKGSVVPTSIIYEQSEIKWGEGRRGQVMYVRLPHVLDFLLPLTLVQIRHKLMNWLVCSAELVFPLKMSRGREGRQSITPFFPHPAPCRKILYQN